MGDGSPPTSDNRPSEPSATAANPMNMRTRSSRAVSRTSKTPQYAPTMGKVKAATPAPARSATVSPSPTGPAPSSHTPSTASSDSTTRPMPKASRAHGDTIWRTGVLGGAFVCLRAAGAFRREDVRPEERDAERRDGEVFVAMGI